MLNFIHFKKTNDQFHGSSLCQILIDGISTMEAISNQLVDLLNVLCEQFPRLWFLSDREVIELLSSHPTPFALEPFVRKCFKGIQCIEVDGKKNSNLSNDKGDMATLESHRQMNVLGIFASFQEHITFLSPLEPNLNTLAWLSVFEKQLKLTMVQLIKQCAAARNQLEPSSQDLACDKKVGDIQCRIASHSKNAQPVLDLLSEYPLQCLLVAEEAIWCNVIQQAFQESSPLKLSNIKAYNITKLKNLVCSMRGGVTGTKTEYLVSKYMMTCLGALVQLTMNYAQQVTTLMEVQGVLESSFEWLSLMKYHIISEAQSQNSNDDRACYVDVLGHCFQYGFEYVGPKNWVVHTLSTDRAALGILLALTNYRCAFLRGPCMSGKTNTVVQLGKALGQQVVTVQCCPSMKPSIFQKMLLGSLHTGALLLLDSVDLLAQGVLSSLAQHLVDIQKSFSETRNKEDKPMDQTADGVTRCTNNIDPECHMVFAGKRFSVNLSYGCVLISSKTDTSEVPPSLRFATRPIALTPPDYKIIAEVMLTSLGFSEAMSLSRRLVSLISLAKDSLCMPFVPDDQYCYLVVLEKIISASTIYLQKSVRQQEMSDYLEELSAGQSHPMPSQSVPARVTEMDGKETVMTNRLQRSYLSVIRGLMEETAIVKAVLSVLLPAQYEHKKASQFYVIFKDAFPIAYQFPLFQHCIEEQEKNQLENAVKEELQRTRCQPHIEMISSSLTLYQAMKFSQTVLLIGPSGCGKTTCYRALAGAFNSLAATTVEYAFINGHVIKGDTPQPKAYISASHWNFVDSMVIFPNAMSHEEIFGYLCEKRGWQDGALTRVLKDSERCENVCSKVSPNEKKTSIVKWLVFDGEPVGQPGWLDYLTTLCNPENPFLCLSSGETLVPRSHLKLIMEVTDLSEASPSAVTRCSLVQVRVTDLWKAVWKSEMDAFYSENTLGQGTLKMWNHLAEDLFNSTLRFLRQSTLNSAIHSKGEFNESHMCGLQEIMSFVRILHALLQYFGKEHGKDKAAKQIHNRGMITTHEQNNLMILVYSCYCY